MYTNENLVYVQRDIINFIETYFFIIFSYYTNCKISNKKTIMGKKFIINCVFIILITSTYLLIKTNINYFTAIFALIGMISLIFSTDNLIKSTVTTIISTGINYVLSSISIIICFITSKILNVNNDYINLIIITILHIGMIEAIFRIKKFKYGFSFLREKNKNEYLDIFLLNISTIILFSIIMFVNSNIVLSRSILPTIILFAIMMFITIQKSLQLYYKQKLLVQELEQTKQELAEKTKEVEELEAENIKISKNTHTLTHKQKSLEHKIEEMMMKTEISKEEATEVRDRLNGIAKDLYKEKTTIELDKTGIAEIDDMLKYMQSECKKNKIDFELQLKGNIHHMTNNLIAKEDVETLLADHIKNAIIAINHTDNINRSILVRLGKIEETYGLYIYDSGIEFETETLENLGKKPSTTHADEGGTGMGFMNTFDTLRKCNASLIIEEYNEPSKDNYTKALLIKFDNKNEFKIKSYRQNEK